MTVVSVHKINWKVFCIKSDLGGHHSGTLTKQYELLGVKMLLFSFEGATKNLNDLKVIT